MQETEAMRQMREGLERGKETIASLREEQKTQVEAKVQKEDPAAPAVTSDLVMQIGRTEDGRVVMQFSFNVNRLIMSVDQARELLNRLRETINNVEPVRRHSKKG